MIHLDFSRRVLVREYAVPYAGSPAVKKYSILACAALSLLLFNGCATSVGEEEDGGLDEDGGTHPDGATHTDAASNKDSGSQSQCVTSCTTDEDCQNSCPEVPNGVNCCDTSTGICYAYSSTECPAPVTDGGLID